MKIIDIFCILFSRVYSPSLSLSLNTYLYIKIIDYICYIFLNVLYLSLYLIHSKLFLF